MTNDPTHEHGRRVLPGQRTPVCDQAGCVDPYGDRYGWHYHCGRCSGPDVTGMYGHLSGGVWRCPAGAATPRRHGDDDCPRS